MCNVCMPVLVGEFLGAKLPISSQGNVDFLDCSTPGPGSSAAPTPWGEGNVRRLPPAV